jgi:hypothetical protein
MELNQEDEPEPTGDPVADQTGLFKKKTPRSHWSCEDSKEGRWRESAPIVVLVDILELSLGSNGVALSVPGLLRVPLVCPVEHEPQRFLKLLRANAAIFVTVALPEAAPDASDSLSNSNLTYPGTTRSG